MARLSEEMISKLEARGWKRWQKNGMDRLYVNCPQLGIEFDYYNTGNISSVTVTEIDGEQWKASNSQGYRMKGAKTYVDVERGTLVSTNDICKRLTQAIIDSI